MRAKLFTCNGLVSREGIEPPNLLIKRQPSFFHSLGLTPFFPYLYPNSWFCFRSKGRTCFLTLPYDENAILTRFCYVL